LHGEREGTGMEGVPKADRGEPGLASCTISVGRLSGPVNIAASGTPP